DVFLLWTVVRAIRHYRPDVLHCHLHEGVMIGWFAKWLSLQAALPVVFDMQGSLTGELEAHRFFEGRLWLLRVFQWIERRIVAMADVCVCSSEASVDLLVKTYRRDPDDVFLARDGADVPVGCAAVAGFDFAHDDRRVVVYSGGLTQTKGLDALQQVIRETCRRALPVRFLVIGYPTEALEAYLAQHELESACILTGQIPFDELGSYLALASIALEPKTGGSGEASGKLVNYMAARLPVICFDTPNNRDMLAGEGFFAPDGDVDGFVDQLQAAIYNPEQADRIGRAGQQRVERLFSWRAAAERIDAAYVKVGLSGGELSEGSKNEGIS
ncbi:MAG: glycosyltransferase family 4 protein, partial [Gammaproteobacteria bacterium]